MGPSMDQASHGLTDLILCRFITNKNIAHTRRFFSHLDSHAADSQAKQNENPFIYQSTVRRRTDAVDDLDSDATPDAIDSLEVFELLRYLNDPEHPLSLEQLNVIGIDGVTVDNAASTGWWRFSPTITARRACR